MKPSASSTNTGVPDSGTGNAAGRLASVETADQPTQAAPLRPNSQRIEQAIDFYTDALRGYDANTRTLGQVLDARIALVATLSGPSEPPEGWMLICVRCGAAKRFPCGWPNDCPTGRGKGAATPDATDRSEP